MLVHSPWADPPRPLSCAWDFRRRSRRTAARDTPRLDSAKTPDAPAGSRAARADDGLRSALQTDMVRQLVGAVGEFVFVVDRSLRVLVVNRGIGERTAKQIEGTLITDFVPPGLHARALSTLHRVLANGQ